MDEVQLQWVRSVEAWIKESEAVIEYNDNEASFLLRQNEFNERRVALLMENNEHIRQGIEARKKQVSEYIGQQDKANPTSGAEAQEVQDGNDVSETEAGGHEGKD